MFKYPTRNWMALRDLDGPEMNTLSKLTHGIADWLDKYRDLGHDAEVMLRVDRLGKHTGYQLVADLFWGGKPVNGQVVVAMRACEADADRDIVERLAALCDNSVDRAEDQPGMMLRSDLPALAAAVASPARRLCPATLTGSSPMAAAYANLAEARCSTLGRPRRPSIHRLVTSLVMAGACAHAVDDTVPRRFRQAVALDDPADQVGRPAEVGVVRRELESGVVVAFREPCQPCVRDRKQVIVAGAER